MHFCTIWLEFSSPDRGRTAPFFWAPREGPLSARLLRRAIHRLEACAAQALQPVDGRAVRLSTPGADLSAQAAGRVAPANRPAGGGAEYASSNQALSRVTV